MLGDEKCMLHATCSSMLFQKACENHHILKHFAFLDASIMCKFIADTYQSTPEDLLVHKILKEELKYHVHAIVLKLYSINEFELLSAQDLEKWYLIILSI